MPLGNQTWPSQPGSIRRPPVAAPPLGVGGLPAPGHPVPGPGADVWRNFTLMPNSSVFTDGGARIDFGGPVSIVEVFAVGPEELFIGWNGPISSTPGAYQLYHPGDGQLVEVVPFISRMWVTTKDGIAPSKRVEVIGKGGAFGMVMSAAWPLVPTEPPHWIDS